MEKAQADILIAELGDRLGIPAMALDADDMAVLSIDGDAVVVAVRYDRQSGAIDLLAGLDDVASSPARLSRMLAASFSWQLDGAIFALDPTTGRLELRRRCAGEGLDSGRLNEALETLVANAIAWSRVLRDLPEGDSAPPAPAELPRPPLGGVRA